MNVVEIESELKKMSNAERLFVIETATRLVRREIIETNSAPREKLSLTESAQLMREEYLTDDELTIFTDSLADQDFYNV